MRNNRALLFFSAGLTLAGMGVCVFQIVTELWPANRVAYQGSMKAMGPLASWRDLFPPMLSSGIPPVLKKQLNKPLFQSEAIFLEPKDSPAVFAWQLPLGGRIGLKYAFMLFRSPGSLVWIHMGSNRFKIIHSEFASTLTLPRVPITQAGDYFLLASVTDLKNEPISLPGMVSVVARATPPKKYAPAEFIWTPIFFGGFLAMLIGLSLLLFSRLRSK
jgi:hypothetical protein